MNQSIILTYIQAFVSRTKDFAYNVKEKVYNLNLKDDTKKVISVVYEKGSVLIVYFINIES